MSRAAERVVWAVVSAWVVVCIEVLVVVAAERARFAGIWELQNGFVRLAPTALVLATTIAVVGAGVAALIERAHSRRARTFLTFFAAVAGTLVGFGVSSGRHFTALPLRGAFVGLLTLGAALGAWVVAPRLATALSRRPGSVALGAVLGILALEVLNRFLLVRLYPAFHLALALAALFFVPLVTAATARWSAARGSAETLRPRATLVALGAAATFTLAGAASAIPAAKSLAHFDNFRLIVQENAPMLGRAVEVAALIAPPPMPLTEACEKDPSACSDDGGPRKSRAHSLDLRGRDVLLISIDALRADHVGAYGYTRRTTPHIDALAKDGFVFSAAYAATPHTSYSVTSLMTGKYVRPLLLQGAGQDSDTWAKLLRTYGYRTAAFYPPAIFFIDAQRFESFQKRGLDFEYRKEEFAEGDTRVSQIAGYLKKSADPRPLFLWTHLFGPHEPYEAHPKHPFGDRDLDRYDSEIAAADETVGRIVELFRAERPTGVVIITADHGEEFGEHGGRYHGTTVYEEQVRVPLVIQIPGRPGRQFAEPVQTIDLLPTLLSAFDIPIPPRIRGRDLSSLLAGVPGDGRGLAHSETEEQSLLAKGSLRLVCARKLGACALYDVATDPKESRDISAEHATEFNELRAELRRLSSSHGRFEARGLRAEGHGFPEAITRGIAGDADAAEEIAGLLDDADRDIRRKAAEILFELQRKETAPALRLALTRDEDPDVRSYAALALTRLGEGAPLVFELVLSGELKWRRLAALALAESGDGRGTDTLIAWWQDSSARDYERSRQLLKAIANVHARDAVFPLVQSLEDVRLRPYIAETLGVIGDDYAKSMLIGAFARERYQSSRTAIARALVRLKIGPEFAAPLVRWLGVPDPIRDGLGYAKDAGILEHVGGPDRDALARLSRQSDLGVALKLIVPAGGNGRGVRAIARARTLDGAVGQIVISGGEKLFQMSQSGELKRTKSLPELDQSRMLRLAVPPARDAIEVWSDVPAVLDVKPGRSGFFVVFADRNVVLEAIAFVPLADELPPPAPKPWKPDDAQASTTPPE